MSSTTEVVVRAGYRIHLGFYRFLDNDIAYGGIAAALENPQITVACRRCSKRRILAPTEYSRDVISKVLDYLGVNDVCIELSGYVTHHRGLGSTTRIVMATLTAVSTLFRMEDSIIEAAFNLGRGLPSSAGLYTFIYGNLVVDSGFKIGANIGEQVSKPKPLVIMPVPHDWYVVVIVPQDLSGIDEESEEHILNNVQPHPKQYELYRQLAKLLASLSLRDFSGFSDALSSIQILTGEYFMEYQGGIFQSGICEEIADTLRKIGVKGVGQSSWGPTIYGFVNSYVKAVEARNTVLNLMSRKGIECRAWITNISSVGHTTTIYLRR